ncbi:MAG: tRNA (adenosine(37)-N6)-dimethylallyltransferase MiaA [Flavobacteriales bacterium]
MSSQKLLICIVGPTAVGKTKIAISVAKHFGAEIISADSRQMFKEIAIGTAKPTPSEIAQVKHHFVDVLNLEDDYSAGQFERESLEFLNTYFQNNDVCVCAGGSGLYVNALLYGFDELPSDEGVRAEIIALYEKEGISALQRELETLDPEYFNYIDQSNTQRVMRAIEVCRVSGKKNSELRTGQKKERPFKTAVIGLSREREELYRRINARVDLMLKEGLVEEVKSVYDRKHLNSLNTVGYRELFGALDGDYDIEEAIRLIKRNSRRFAKRQLTWFKRLPEINWFHPEEDDKLRKHLDQFYKGGKLSED